MQRAVFKVTVFLPWCLAFPVPPAIDLKGLDFIKDYSHQIFRTKKESPLLTQGEDIQHLPPFHLNETDLQDEQTLAVPHHPHCGVTDGANDSTFPGSSKWDKHTLTYRIINYPRDINPSIVKGIMQDTVSIWSNVTLLIFQQVKNQDADIKISFWDLGFNLFLVAIHELGHSLGLLHSKSLNSIMYPRYVNWDPRTFHLDGDDIKRIQQLYGLCLLEGRVSGQEIPLGVYCFLLSS
ncbi:matrix metalloproteinase-26 isoform X1 [Zalophus californianus]|uniref:Matrix metalloproteinase-26 isoform X1 n=1 Tax=Zalophus californianus TaxID=9704 RepID=A0A6J2C0Y4_ZALCA|nr:matrix metalloproteinase-26 isoform X1 [Zalophus californianus]